MKATDGLGCSARNGYCPVHLGLMDGALSVFASNKGKPWVPGLANAAGTQTVARADSSVLVAQALVPDAAQACTICVPQGTLRPVIVGVATT